MPKCPIKLEGLFTLSANVALLKLIVLVLIVTLLAIVCKAGPWCAKEEQTLVMKLSKQRKKWNQITTS